MREDFLHYVWKYLKIEMSNLQTTDGLPISIYHNGTYLKESGPDFFNAKIQIGEQIWAGNVEIHIHSSDWYVHHHEVDPAYQNVILHVVWQNDITVLRSDGTPIPTLELKNIVDINLLENYQKTFDNKQILPCKNQWNDVPKEKIHWYQEELLIQKLDEKSIIIQKALKENNNYWEQVFCRFLFRNFGTKINGDNFEKIFSTIPYTVLQKERNSVEHLEALLYGQSNLLPIEAIDTYTKEKIEIYQYLQHKYQLAKASVKLEYFKLRPDNFPSIRISQFSNLLAQHQTLFFEILNLSDKKEFYQFFKTKASNYWDDKFVFGKEISKIYPKKMSNSFVDLLLINTILPMQYTYFKDLDEEAIEKVIAIYHNIAFENNTITKMYNTPFFKNETAGNSQSLLYLNKEYCKKKKCLNCTIGTSLLNKNYI